ncbi:hypothetical protein BpHYR1_019224 [Brachionus plicatilis]|uniref:Uncharacterized protein n=1 Tax=Brachionus plicatilis TaxID=10195 RepID=A0A3M7QHH7_BRAPC|nr:hypothetical protein BpHYR1_019224 [Brachionus plicatilis]
MLIFFFKFIYSLSKTFDTHLQFGDISSSQKIKLKEKLIFEFNQAQNITFLMKHPFYMIKLLNT